MYIYMCVYIYMYVCMFLSLHIIYICVCVCMYIYIYIYMHAVQHLIIGNIAFISCREHSVKELSHGSNVTFACQQSVTRDCPIEVYRRSLLCRTSTPLLNL